MIINGSLNSPQAKPDFSGLAKKVLVKEFENRVKKYTNDIWKKLDLDKLFH